MAIISIESVEIGMTLTDDVVDKQGRALLRAGVDLNEKQIRMLKTWGVMTINVVQDSDGPQNIEDFPPLWQNEARELADSRFQTSNQQFMVIEKLKLIWTQRFLQNKQARGQY